jgi:cytochrome P450
VNAVAIHVHEEHCGASRGQRDAGRATDPARCAGDDCGFVRELHFSYPNRVLSRVHRRSRHARGAREGTSGAAGGFARGEEVGADPYGFFARLRHEEPLHLDRDGLYRLTRYHDVAAALTDERLSADDAHWQRCDPFAETILAGLDSPAARARREWFLNMDDPPHRRLRTAIASAFTPRASAAYRPAVQRALDHLLDDLRPANRADFLASVIRPLPATALASAFGFPPDEWRQCVDWVREINRNFDRNRTPAEVDSMNRAVVEFEEYLRGKIANVAGGDAFSALVANARNRGLADDELIPTLTIVFVAGQHVMVKLLGGCLIRLLGAGGAERERLRREPSSVGDFVDEMLRWDSPVQGLKRVATADVEIAGGVIPKDRVVVMMLGSANRDETVFPNPDAFDPDRCDPRAIPLGIGAHFCLGAYLGKLEAVVFVETVLRRFEGLAFAGPPPALPVSRRGVPRLDVVWDHLT